MPRLAGDGGASAVCSALAPLRSAAASAACGRWPCLSPGFAPGLGPCGRWPRWPWLGSLRSLGVASGRFGRWRAACARLSPPRPPPGGLRCGAAGPGGRRACLGGRSVPSSAGLRVALGLPRAPWWSPCAALRASLRPLPRRAGSLRLGPLRGSARSSRRGAAGRAAPAFSRRRPRRWGGCAVLVAGCGHSLGPGALPDQPPAVKGQDERPKPPLTAGVGSGRTGVRRRPGPGRPERTTKHDGGAL